MSQRLKKLYVCINYYRTIPAYFIIKSCKYHDKCMQDYKAYMEHSGFTGGKLFTFSKLLVEEVSIRNVFMNRLHRNPIKFLIFRLLFKPLDSLYINTPPELIGGGLSFQHGFSTIVAAKSIGENCRIYQQCTVGFNGDEAPVIGNNCRICAGSHVIGGVRLYSNCVVGAGSVVVKDVPENSIVAGVPAKIIKKNFD